jgi:hypothetical protein
VTEKGLVDLGSREFGECSGRCEETPERERDLGRFTEKFFLLFGQ